MTIDFEILQKNETKRVNGFDSLMKVVDAVASNYFTCWLDTVAVAADGQTLED